MEYFKPFFVKIAGRAREGDHTSAHDEVVAPLLAGALEAYVYCGLSHETQSINRRASSSASCTSRLFWRALTFSCASGANFASI